MSSPRLPGFLNCLQKSAKYLSAVYQTYSFLDASKCIQLFSLNTSYVGSNTCLSYYILAHKDFQIIEAAPVMILADDGGHIRRK